MKGPRRPQLRSRHEMQLVAMAIDPYFADLRREPRFVDIVARVGLPPVTK